MRTVLLDLPQPIYLWDGFTRLRVLGEPWWLVEHEYPEGLARALLFHVTADAELADRRAKAFAQEILTPLWGAPASILTGAVEHWLLASGPADVKVSTLAAAVATLPDLGARIRCAGCQDPIAMHPRHREFVTVFGTRCDRCRGVTA